LVPVGHVFPNGDLRDACRVKRQGSDWIVYRGSFERVGRISGLGFSGGGAAGGAALLMLL
jgi:hypothetical protein